MMRALKMIILSLLLIVLFIAVLITVLGVVLLIVGVMNILLNTIIPKQTQHDEDTQKQNTVRINISSISCENYSHRNGTINSNSVGS